MTRIRLSTLVLAALVGVIGVRRAEAGVSLDPFRRAGTASSLDPFRVAQATTPAQTPAPSPAAAPAAKSCHVDEDCPEDNICSNQTCQAIQVSTNILYLYYREGAFRELLGLYWARKGPTGYTVVVPVWWHYWSPQSHARVFAPFFWRFEDFARSSVVTVIVPGLPISWSHEPGASSFGVWPLFYKSTKFGWAAPLLGTFKVADPDVGRSFGAVMFLYWWKRAPGSAFDLLFPLFVSSRSPQSSFTYAVPLNFYWRQADHEHTLAIPFFYAASHNKGSSLYTLLGYRSREGSERSGAALWLYWYGRDDKERTAHDVLFPLVWDFRGATSRSTVVFPFVWHFRRDDSRATVVFPLVWSFGSTASNTTVAGPWVHLRRANWTFDTVVPLWWSATNGDEGSAFRALLPFFFWQSAAHGRKVAWYAPIGGYARDDDARSKTLVLLPLLSFYRRDPQHESRMYTPLFIQHRSFDTQSQTTLVGLAALYLRRDADGTTSMFTPLVWHFRAAPSGATATAVLPFFAHRAGPRDESTYAGVFPLWFYWRRFAAGGWGGGLFPLAFFGSNAGRSHAVVFPLLWHFAGASSSTTVAAPLFYWRRDGRGYDGGIPPVLTFFGNRDGDSYAIQFPLFWRFASARQGWSTTVTPLGYLHRDPDGWSAGLGPLLPVIYLRSGTKRSHFAIFPLLWHFRDADAQRTTTVAGLYLHRTWGGETTDALFPLLHYRRGARPGGSDETSFTLFPFVHYRRDAETRVVVTPVAAWARGPHRAGGFAGPYFWYRDADLSVGTIPLLYTKVERRTTGERTTQLGPWFHVSGPGHSGHVLFPFYGHYEDAVERDTYVFPTFFHQRRTDGGAVDALLPLFWRSSFGGRTTTVVGPWYDRTSPGAHNTGLVPLWFHARNEHRSLTVIPAALFVRHHDRDNDHERIWFALLWHNRDHGDSSTTVFPIWWSANQGGRSHQVFFPLFWRFADANEHTQKALLGLFYWASYGGGGTMRGLMPIAWYSRDPAQGAGSNAVMPLFYEAHGPERFTFLTLLAGYRRDRADRLWYLWPAFFSDKVESRFGMVAPFWFSKTNKVTRIKTTVIPPLLYVSRGNDEEALTTCAALFWRHRDIGSSTTLGLPLYFDVHDYHLSRTTVFLPLFLRHQNDVDKSVFWVAPLFYRHETPSDTTMVGFPLLWHFKRGDSTTTVFFPFYAHWQRPDYASTYIFPTIYHRHGLTAAGAPDGTWRYIVAPFYDAAVKRPGDFMWEVLGGLVGHERIGRNRYLKLFFMTFETQPAPRAQTAWYSQPVHQSRKAAPRGLSMNRW